MSAHMTGEIALAIERSRTFRAHERLHRRVGALVRLQVLLLRKSPVAQLTMEALDS